MGRIFDTFHALQKKWDEAVMRPRGLCLGILIIIFFLVLLVALWLKTLIALGCIVIVAAVVLPVYLKDWHAGTSFLLILCGTILLLHEQAWFQGFFENTTIGLIQKQGKEYGEKLKEFQEAMAALNAENASNSAAITSALATVRLQQENIDAQEDSLREVELRVTGLVARAESILGRAEEKQLYLETNLTAFATADQRVRDLDSSLWGRLTDWHTEFYRFADTNAVLAFAMDELTNGVVVLVRLEQPPIEKTIQLDIATANPISSVTLLRDNILTLNVAQSVFDQGVKGHGIRIRYLPNPYSQSLYSWSIVSSNVFELNGVAMTPVKTFIVP